MTIVELLTPEFKIGNVPAHSLQVLSIFRWRCIKGPTKPFGPFTGLKEV